MSGVQAIDPSRARDTSFPRALRPSSTASGGVTPLEDTSPSGDSVAFTIESGDRDGVRAFLRRSEMSLLRIMDSAGVEAVVSCNCDEV